MDILGLEGVELSNLLEEIPPYQRLTIDELLASGMSQESAAEVWLDQIGALSNAPFGTGTAGPGLFDNFKKEFNKLICGDAAYEQVRKEASVAWKKYKSGVVLSFAAAIGAFLGVTAIVLVPAVALMISAATKIGVNAWCETYFAQS